jgi:hypothetical protein
MWLQCAVPETVVSACLALPAAGNEDTGGAGSGPRASHIAGTRMHERRVRVDHSAVIQVRNLCLYMCVCVCTAQYHWSTVFIFVKQAPLICITRQIESRCPPPPPRYVQ